MYVIINNYYYSCFIAGVEHLLRDVKDATISTLATDVGAKLDVSRRVPTSAAACLSERLVCKFC